MAFANSFLNGPAGVMKGICTEITPKLMDAYRWVTVKDVYNKSAILLSVFPYMRNVQWLMTLSMMTLDDTFGGARHAA